MRELLFENEEKHYFCKGIKKFHFNFLLLKKVPKRISKKVTDK